MPKPFPIQPPKWQRWGKYLLLALLSLGLCLSAVPSIAIQPLPEREQFQTEKPMPLVQNLSQRGQQLYEAGQFAEAATVLEQAIQTAEKKGEVLEQVMALRNLALVYQALGQWEKANQTIATGLELINSVKAPARSPMLASLLDVQGSLQLKQGQAESALATWERANQLYQQLGDREKAVENQIDRAQALQRLGFYRRAIAILTPIVQTQEQQPDSLSKAVALRSLGDALQFVGDLDQARQQLEASLEVAKRLQLPEAIGNAQLSLGNTWRAKGDANAALAWYQEAAGGSAPETLRVQAQLNQLSLLIETGQTGEAKALWPQIQGYLDRLPPSHATIFARINLAQSLIKLNVQQNPTPQVIAQILATAIQQARLLKDLRAESYAIGTLGNLYERSGQWLDAQKLSEQALLLAQNQNSLDIAYRWQWQLGRIFRAKAEIQANQEDYKRAIAAYSEAVNTLKVLRTDLVAVNPQIQVSFQDSIEPIHRELVGLLLEPKRGEISPDDLEKALQVIESLQLAELDNFLKEACLKATPVNIDQVDLQAAVIYPIILRDRLEVIVSLPKQQLRHYTRSVERDQFERVASELRQLLARRIGKRYLQDSQQLYDWMIRPAEADLVASNVKTLVFVLDGVLRNLPMAALHDGKQFLIEKFSVALTPGLQLLNPRPLQEQTLKVFTAGLSESRQGFSALPNIVTEVKEIQSAIPTQVLLNQNFTEVAFKEALSLESAPIVHLATHGKFSSKKEDTFVLTWDGRLEVSTLTNILQATELNQTGPIELLVLSACETATGDKLAALGMAGMAVRSGVRSTIASLWQINDEATAILMNRLYDVLASRKTTKAEALRQAQLKILRDNRFREQPYFWAPYVLVGNWL